MARLGAKACVLLFGLLGLSCLGSEVVSLNDNADSAAAAWHVGPPRKDLGSSSLLGESRINPCNSCGQMGEFLPW